MLCGREYTAYELLDEIFLDKAYYGAEGGVTFSGGEPLAQPELLSEVIDLCKAAGIGCAVETSMIFYNREIFEKLDLIMADLKIWDNEVHRQYTGLGNEKIKENFKRLDELNIPIIMRTPVIPGIRQEIDKISMFSKELKNVIQYELLPYHPLGEAKYRALGREMKKFEIPSKEYMEELSDYAYICR